MVKNTLKNDVIFVEANELILCKYIGEAGDPAQYEMQANNDFSPMILSKKTGRRVIFPWRLLINLAIECGVDIEYVDDYGCGGKSV